MGEENGRYSVRQLAADPSVFARAIRCCDFFML
jgi:hypothetical protein